MSDEANEIEHSNTRTEQKRARQGAFLAAYERLCHVGQSCAAAGIGRTCHYEWLESDESYREAFRRSKLIAADMLEDEAVRRGCHGWEEPVTVAGEKEIVRKYDSRLLEVLLKGHKPDTYKERRELTGKDGAALIPLDQIDSIIRDAIEGK